MVGGLQVTVMVGDLLPREAAPAGPILPRPGQTFISGKILCMFCILEEMEIKL